MLRQYVAHAKTFGVGEMFPNAFIVDVFVGVHAYDKPVTIVSPLPQLLKEILSEFQSRASEVVASCDPISPLLLVGSIQILFDIVTRIVSTYHLRSQPLRTIEGHHHPTT